MQGWTPRSTSLLAVIVIATGWLTPAWAGNDEGIFVGNQAALTAAAVTAIVADGSGGWYNPAGLAHVTRPTLDLAINIYGFRQVTIENLLVTPDGSAGDASVTDWVLIPSGLSFVRQVGRRCSVGFGIFVPRTNDYIVRVNVTDQSGATWIAAGQETFASYNFALSFAWRQTDNLRFGASLIGTYASTYSAYELAGGDLASQGIAGQVAEIFGAQNYGLRLNAGVQWTWNNKLEVGVMVMSPGITLLAFRDSTRAATIAGAAVNDAQQIEDESTSEWTFRMTDPLVVRAGIAWRAKWGYISVDGDVALPVDADDEDRADDLLEFGRTWNGNARVGGLFKVSNKIRLGGGLFTDLDPRDQGGLDFFGLAFGVAFRHDYEVEGGRQISFHTTLGGRYAYGTGEALGLRVGSLEDPGSSTLAETDASSHELSASIGTILHF